MWHEHMETFFPFILCQQPVSIHRTAQLRLVPLLFDYALQLPPLFMFLKTLLYHYLKSNQTSTVYASRTDWREPGNAHLTVKCVWSSQPICLFIKRYHKRQNRAENMCAGKDGKAG